MSDAGVIAARLVQFGSALVLFGSSLFFLYALKGDASGLAARPWPRWAILIAAIAALAGTIMWIAAQTAAFFPDAGAFDFETIGILLTETRFGLASLVRIILLVVAIALAIVLPLARILWILQSLLGAAILASFAWTGHGAADSGWPGAVHTGADILHLLAAGVWIGALPVLCVFVLRALRTRTEADARAVLTSLERFSGIGPAMVCILILTGLVNSWFLLLGASWSALFASFYGVALTAKLVLFVGMLFLAAANRLRLSPQLKRDLEHRVTPGAALAALRTSLLAETALALLVVIAVAALGTFEPPRPGND